MLDSTNITSSSKKRLGRPQKIRTRVFRHTKLLEIYISKDYVLWKRRRMLTLTARTLHHLPKRGRGDHQKIRTRVVRHTKLLEIYKRRRILTCFNMR